MTNPDPQSPPARLHMVGVKKRFGATVALAGVDLSVNAGQVLALVGENGAGKSTLMKVLSGAHLPDEGTMTLDGQPYSPRDPLDARRAGVAMIYQELSMAKHLSVMENILLGVEPTVGPFMRWSQVRSRAAAAMKEVGREDIPLDTPVGQLSVAEQQLVEIARAVANECRVLVFDEPTSSLTQSDIVRLFSLINRLKGRGQAIIYISHFLEEVKEISDRFTVLRDGQSVGGGVTAEVPSEKIIAMMVGRTVADLYPRSPRRQGAVILTTDKLAGTSKPRSASFSLHRGEVVGIAGLVGAGRTEFLRAMFGLDAVTSGDIRLSTYVGPASPAARWAQGMGIVSEDRKTEGLALSLSIGNNLTLSKLQGMGPSGLVLPGRQDKVASGWIKKMNVKCAGPAQPIGALSGGNQQKVAIARLLHHDVDVLLLDEPTRGIDVGSKAQIYTLIDELALAGKAILIVSSYLPELMGVCDRIAVMCRGVLGPARPIAGLTEHQIMIEATGSENAA
jgi:ribose transport system ATP-binding protein